MTNYDKLIEEILNFKQDTSTKCTAFDFVSNLTTMYDEYSMFENDDTEIDLVYTANNSRIKIETFEYRQGKLSVYIWNDHLIFENYKFKLYNPADTIKLITHIICAISAYHTRMEYL